MDVIDSFVRTICMMQGAFTIGACIAVFFSYVPKSNRVKHIMAVAISHILLTILVAHALIQRLYVFYPWRLPTAMLAFALSDYAILKIYMERK